MQKEDVEKIDPEREYSLGYLLAHNMFGGVKQFSTARARVLEDLVSEHPILNTSVAQTGNRRMYTIKGSNLIAYFNVRS